MLAKDLKTPTEMGSTTHTAIADIHRVAERHLEVHVRECVRIDGTGIAQVMQERQRLCGDERVVVMLTLPPELDLDLGIMNVDHYKVNDAMDGIIAMAVLAEGTMSETMARLYIAFFPPVFPLQVFTTREEAERWLSERLLSGAAR